MPDTIVVDTDILIDIGRDIRDARDYLSELGREKTLAISMITNLELIVGCRNKSELALLDHFISLFQVIKLNNRISDIAFDLLKTYRLSHGLLIPDALIAATAISVDCPLLSKNQRDFRFINELDLLPYHNPFV